MITQKIATMPAARTPRGNLESDAAVWANLLDDYLGPENDVYSHLLKSSQKKQASKPS